MKGNLTGMAASMNRLAEAGVSRASEGAEVVGRGSVILRGCKGERASLEQLSAGARIAKGPRCLRSHISNSKFETRRPHSGCLAIPRTSILRV